MAVVRQASALLLAALFMSRGLFAQDALPPPPAPPAPPEVPGALPPAPADQAHVTLRPIELRYVQQETLLVPQTRSEERRVGKECRSRWSPDDQKKKKEAARGLTRQRP